MGIFLQMSSANAARKAKTSSVRFHSCLALIVACVFLVLIWNEDMDINIDTQSERKMQETENINEKVEVEDVDKSDATRRMKKLDEVPYRHEDVIFGHIHMARTAGSSLNWNLSNHYERVCGNKGYSYDAYTKGTDVKQAAIVKSIGFEDCDYISMETDPGSAADFWFQFDHFHNTPMELHVPCREPIDYLMSLCNYEKVRGRADGFDCDGLSPDSSDEDIADAVNVCLHFIDRYDDKLLELQHVQLKCYDFKQQFKSYLDYMKTKLQERRFVAEEPKELVKTPWPRHKDEECIWKHEGLKRRVEKYLESKVPYFRYCKACVGSENDVTRPDGPTSSSTE